MNQREWLEALTRITKTGVATLQPGPIKIAVSPTDAIASKLLLWLFEQMPADATSADLHDVLDSAKWWMIFGESMQLADEQEAAKLDSKL